MAEPLRTFALMCMQQAQTRVYEGRPFEPWNNPYRHSLPPAPDRPKKEPAGSAVGGNVRATREIVAARAAAVLQMLAEGRPAVEVAEALGIPSSYVHSIKYRERLKGTAADDSPPVATALAKAAFFTFEVPALPPHITRTVQASTAPRSGTHVLDWQQRMAAYTFDGEPGKKPKKSRSSHKGCTHQQINGVMRSNHGPTVAARINPVRALAQVHLQTIAPARISPFDWPSQ